MRLSGAVLWLHVLGGVSWVGAAAAFVLAAAALAGASRERRDFALRAAPRFNQLGLGCAAVILPTGIANLAFAAQARGGPLPPVFIGIVGIKLGLYTLMAWLLWRAMGRVDALRRLADADDGVAVIRGLVLLYGLSVAAGGSALLMGLWLAGV